LGVLVATAPYLAAEEVRSVRGAVAIEKIGKPPDVTRQRLYDGPLPRSFKGQPALIPHKIHKYEVDLKINQCLRCHDRPYYKAEEAPKISDSHYQDREGRELNEIARARWFCTQCHVPQADIEPPIANTFETPYVEEVGGAE
jgi:cytochrome c-type protein NapB